MTRGSACRGGALQVYGPDGGGRHCGSGAAELLPGLRGSRASGGSGRVLEQLAWQKPRGGNGGGQLGPWDPHRVGAGAGAPCTRGAHGAQLCLLQLKYTGASPPPVSRQSPLTEWWQK